MKMNWGKLSVVLSLNRGYGDYRIIKHYFCFLCEYQYFNLVNKKKVFMFVAPFMPIIKFPHIVLVSMNEEKGTGQRRLDLRNVSGDDFAQMFFFIYEAGDEG